MLASAGVHLYNIGRKFRCFAIERAMSNAVACFLSMEYDGKNLSLNDRRRLVDTVGSRSASVLGPLTISLYIAVIMESTPSWKTFLNTPGLVTSCQTTERYNKKLIVFREKAPLEALQTFLQQIEFCSF